MSTEHQQYSTANQMDAIREYAERRRLSIVKTYADEGKSGLNLAGRTALKRLIDEVRQGQQQFQAILVYDVSRWGRFQDADESAYYEYLCKQAGIAVHYCAEQFENDGGPAATIIKSVKRAMAGEYSRELSTKVFQGQCRLVELGYRQGGAAGYGLRRMLIDHTGAPKGVLHRGEQKSLQTDRVVLVPGPEEEIAVVRRVYRLFLDEGKREAEIAALLNGEGLRTELGRAWTRGTVAELLTNEKYIGNNVYNRVSFKLKKKRIVNAPEMWVRAAGAFAPLVSAADFFTVQGIIQERNRRWSNEQLLTALRSVVAAHGRLSAALIDRSEGLPTSCVYRARFGSLIQAYRLAGYVPERDYAYLDAQRQLRQLHPQLLADLVRELGSVGAEVNCQTGTGLLEINRRYSATLALSRCRQSAAGRLSWSVQIDERLAPDITILVRMDADNARPIDYYLFPLLDLVAPRLLLCETNGAYLDTYHFANLEFFARLAGRRRIEVAA